MKLELQPSSERFDPDDERWLNQVALLAADLRREVGEVSRHSGATPGTKGIELGSIIVSLGSAGAFTAVAQVLQAFLDRDRGRSVKLSWHEGGKLESFEMQGPDIDAAVIDHVVTVLQQAPEAGQPE